MEHVEFAWRVLLWAVMVFLSITSCICLVRAIMGPRFTDRIICVNIVITKSIIMIAILSELLDAAFLMDIAIVYAMIGFLAVVVLSKCYLMPHHVNPADPVEAPAAEERETEVVGS